MISIEDIEAMRDEDTVEQLVQGAADALAYEFNPEDLQVLIMAAMYAGAKLSADKIQLIAKNARDTWLHWHNR